MGRILESVGLEPPPRALVNAAGGALWLRFDPRTETPVLEGRHPDRLLRMCFALDIWAMRSHLLSSNLMSFLGAHARPELPIVVDLDPVRWRSASAASELPRWASPGRLVVTGIQTEAEGQQIVGFDPDGEPGAWPAAWVVAAAHRPHRDAHVDVVTLHQPLVRRRPELDPPRILRYGLRRVVGQMRQSIPDLGTTGLAAFDPLCMAARADEALSFPGADDLGRGAFVDVLLLAAEVLGRPDLVTTGERLGQAAAAWRELGRMPAGPALAPRAAELERLERQVIDDIAGALALARRVAVPRAMEATAAASRAAEPRDATSQGAAADTLSPTTLDTYVHHRGVHCASMALHNLAHHYMGCKWSEALCFGLAAGLNFTYLREPGSPMFLLMGRGTDMEEHFADAIGAHLETFRSDDDERAFDHLLLQLDAGRLVVLEADMFHLPYLVQSLDLMEGVHFGGHKLFVTGYDPASGTVTVHDYAWKEPFVLTVEQLRIARGSRDCPEPPRNGCFVFHFPDEPAPLDEAILRALRTFVQQMRRPFMRWNGLPAIERFCRQVARWARVMAPQELALNVRLTGFMFERAGTGGGNFRNLYYRFLRQAAEQLNAPELSAVAGHYQRLARAWREVAALLDEATEDPARGMFDPSRRPQVLLNEISELERRAVDDVDDFLRRREVLA